MKNDFSDYDTNSVEELLTELGLDLMRINNKLFPKLGCMPFASKDDEGLMLAIYHSLANTQSEVMSRLRKGENDFHFKGE